MTDHPAPLRRYDEEEVSRLLKRASELQRSSPAAPNPAGLTLAELEEIAAEAGLDVAHLRRAAIELDSGSSPMTSGIGPKLLGGPLRIHLERSLPFEVPESVFAGLVPAIQMAADAPGQASQVGRTLTWSSHNPSQPRSLQVLVAVRSGQTVVRIEERLGNLAGGIFGGGVGGVGGGVGIGAGVPLGAALGSAITAVGIPLVVIGATYIGARALYGAQSRKRMRTLEQLMGRLVEDLTRAAEDSRPD